MNLSKLSIVHEASRNFSSCLDDTSLPSSSANKESFVRCPQVSSPSISWNHSHDPSSHTDLTLPLLFLSPRSAGADLLAVPHGGKLINLMTDDASATSGCDFELQLTPRQLCDIELIMNGGFSPLTGFMNEASYTSVVNDMALPSGLIFSLPVIFDTDSEELQPGHKVLFKDGDRDIAVVKFTDKYLPDKPLECLKVYGTSSLEHPGTLMVATERGKYYMGGEVLAGINLPVRDFVCRTPAEVRAELPGGTDVVAFQCRNPIHRAHYELFTRALTDDSLDDDAVVLVHPTCGPTQADDIPGTVRYKTYEVLKEETKNPRTKWAYLP